MQRVKADRILFGVAWLSSLQTKFMKESDRNQVFAPDGLEMRIKDTEGIAIALAECGLLIAKKHADGFLETLRAAETAPDGNKLLRGVNLEKSIYHMGMLLSVISEEAETKTFLLISPSAASLYAASTPIFGNDVDKAFQGAAYDLDEAAKCLALERSTAAVFHLMRAMESAVAIAGNKIGASVTNQQGETLPWGIIVGNIRSKIEAMAKGPIQDKWLKIHALLHSVNRAFRTKTAHPVQKYTPEEAESAFNATKSFMQELAVLCL